MVEPLRTVIIGFAPIIPMSAGTSFEFHNRNVTELLFVNIALAFPITAHRDFVGTLITKRLTDKMSPTGKMSYSSEYNDDVLCTVV